VQGDEEEDREGRQGRKGREEDRIGEEWKGGVPMCIFKFSLE